VELRRIEGVLLEQSLLTSKGEEVLKTAKNIEIKITSQVPEVYKTLLNLNKVKAKVIKSGGNVLTLLLENGLEIRAKNELSVALRKGQNVVLTLINTNPITFKLEEGKFVKNTALEILRRGLKNLKKYDFKQIRSYENFKNSGIFYENKVLKYLIRNSFKEIKEDMKYKAFSKGDRELLEFINFLQMYALENPSSLFIPFKLEKFNGFLSAKVKDFYRIFAHISTKEFSFNALFLVERNMSFAELEFSSEDKKVLEKLENLKGEIRRVFGLPLRNIKFVFKEDAREEALKEVLGEGGLDLKV